METKHEKYVSECTKYNLFKTLPGNRPLEKGHTASIIRSLEASKHFHGSLIVIKTKAFSKSNRYELYLGDGQHRLAAVTELGIPYNYEVVSMVEDTRENIINYVASINTSSKNWGLSTYLDAFASLEIPQYIKMQKILTENKLSVNDLIAIYNPNKSDSVARFEFKTGKFELCDEIESDKLLASVLKFKELIPDRYNTRREIYPILRQTMKPAQAAKVIQETAKALKEHASPFPKDGAELLELVVTNLVMGGVEFKEFGSLSNMPKKKREMFETMRKALNKAKRKMTKLKAVG